MEEYSKSKIPNGGDGDGGDGNDGDGDSCDGDGDGGDDWKRWLIECMQYEKFASFTNSILHMVTLASHSLNPSLIAKVQGRLS